MATIVEMRPTSDPVAPLNVPGPAIASSGDDVPAAFAPLIYNAWYVVAETRDIGRELLGIKVLGEPLVIYRTEAGEAVVLDDRCAHRRYSLSKSRLVGDTIQCGYHGFTYEASGACIWAPTMDVKPRFGVRRYPAAEVGPWLWVWMGNPDRADPADIPYPKLDPDETWHTSTGYKMNPGNYMLLIENFLDLTHLHFLHGAEISDIKAAETPPRSEDLGPNSVGWSKTAEGVPAGFFAALSGRDPTQLVNMHATDSQIGPSMNWGGEVRTALAGSEDERYPLRFHIAHGVTPQDMSSTHQFFEVAFNVELTEGIDNFRDISRDVVFQQDVDAITLMQDTVVNDHRTGTVEFGIPGDRFGIKMRQILRRMKQDEA